MRLYDLTRKKTFLQRGCALIFAVSILICWIVQFFRTVQPVQPERVIKYLEDRFSIADFGQLDARYQRLRLQPVANPEEAAIWLRDATRAQADLYIDNAGQAGEPPLMLLGCNVTELIAQHGRNEVERGLFTDYALLCLLPKENAKRESARQRLQQQAALDEPPRFANQFFGDVELANERVREALRCYLREMHHKDAAQARKLALRIALQLEDHAALEMLTQNRAQFRSETTQDEMRMTAKLLKDHALLWASHWRLIVNHWLSPVHAFVALMACLIWGVILYCSGNRQLRAIWLCFTGLIAGMLSVWLLRWWLDAVNVGINEELMAVSVTHQILHWVMYVGVPEEAAKLLVILPFAPFMLKRTGFSISSSNAALLGGFVGLGFALEENLQYFQQVDESVALGRLVTANVMHFTLTGIIAWQLHDLMASRFHRATDFLVTFVLIALAHGLYDFFVVNDSREMWQTGIFGIIILAVCTRYYFRRLPTEQPVGRRFTISRTCVFVFGASLLSGFIMLITTLEAPSIEFSTISPVLYAVLQLIPICLIYVHELGEVQR